MSNKLCPYCGEEPQPRGTRWVICVTESCPNRASVFTPEQWNRRFVCLDKNGDKVFNDSIITGWRGDHEVDECRLQFKEFCWWATEVQATFDVTPSYRLSGFDEIELVKEVA